MKSIFAILKKNKTVEYVLAKTGQEAENVANGEFLASYTIKYYQDHEKTIQKFWKKAYQNEIKEIEL